MIRRYKKPADGATRSRTFFALRPRRLEYWGEVIWAWLEKLVVTEYWTGQCWSPSNNTPIKLLSDALLDKLNPPPPPPTPIYPAQASSVFLQQLAQSAHANVLSGFGSQTSQQLAQLGLHPGQIIRLPSP